MATFQDVILKIPGLVAYYPLNENANDVVGDAHGVASNVEFDGTHAVFDGNDSEIELPDRDFFSAAGNSSKELSIFVMQTIDDWTERSDNNEYVHWMGKGKSGAHEWTFRYYCDGCGGEAPERKRRTSYYNFNPDGGLGTGSYFQDANDGNGTERVITGMIWGDAGNGGKTQMWKNGELRDTDNLSDYDVYPQNTGSKVFLGSRGDGTGNLVGRLRRVAFFNRKLTESEIVSLYNARNNEEGSGGGGTTPPPVTPPAETGFGDVVIGTAKYPVDDVDSPRTTDDLIVYTPDFGANTGTSEYGAEASVVNGKVTKLESGVGSLVIPRDGYVLSGHGAAKTWLTTNAKVGATVTLTEDLVPPPTGGGGGGEVPDNSDIEAAYAAAKAALDTLNTKMDALGDAIDAG